MQFGCKCCDNEPAERINVGRFLTKLDGFLNTNDMSGAERCLDYWAEEAAALGDKRGLLTVTNEQIGFYRRLGDKDKAVVACEKALQLLAELDVEGTVSGETVAVNIATTLGAYGMFDRAMAVFAHVDDAFRRNNATDSYEYAAFVNNLASTQYLCGMYDKAESNLMRAVELLRKEGNHLYDIAVSMCLLAELYRKKYNDTQKSLQVLDEAWTVLCDENIVRDGNYAFALTKCYPVFAEFGLDMQAEALKEIAAEIYGGNL